MLIFKQITMHFETSVFSLFIRSVLTNRLNSIAVDRSLNYYTFHCIRYRSDFQRPREICFNIRAACDN